ncbi:MAG: Gfo/Idh/MocA family oxidoreductase [Ruminococcaceae bacterium]|nr:Gfo/Idh/MocA family oxidoreductase [Oscillospiraceae bacterium]
MKKLKAIVIGCGNRGINYSTIMSWDRDRFEVVAIAEPIDDRRNYLKNMWDIPENRCFSSFEALLALGKIADFAIIATMDRMHYAPAMKAIELGYDLLLEKPISPTKEECVSIAKAAEERNVRVVICTVLRYSAIFKMLKKLIDEGQIGKITSVNHEECVGNVHFSHSFTRGNWKNSEESSNMLLQKSCHDLDILYWLIGKKCRKIQSFGSLEYFTEKNAPEGAPDYCIEGCPKSDTCPYNAVKLYLDDKENAWFRTTATKLTSPTDEDVEKAIRTTEYGKCVFKCSNNVVDRQTVNMLFEDGITATFTMNPFNSGGRNIHIMGTEGEIRSALDARTPITVYRFETGKTEEFDITACDSIVGGHGGGDGGLINELYDYLNDNYSGCSVPTINESLYGHLLVFAAEESRLSGRIVDVESFINE